MILVASLWSVVVWFLVALPTILLIFRNVFPNKKITTFRVV